MLKCVLVTTALALIAPTSPSVTNARPNAPTVEIAAPTSGARPGPSRQPGSAPVPARSGASRAQPDPGLRDPNIARPRPRISVFPDDDINRARADDAVRRFTAAGLRLPDVAIDFTGDDCLGNLGLFDQRTEPWQISVCSDLEFVLTHELVHAWVASNLDEADREAYVEFRGLSVWSDPDLHWRERGTEDAAFMVQQVLMTDHIRPGWSVWEERSAAYRQLTGQRPPQLVALDAARGVPTRTRHGSSGEGRRI